MGQYSNLPSAVVWWKKVLLWKKIKKNYSGTPRLDFLWYVLFSALINFASSQCKYFKTTFNSQGPLVQSRLKKKKKTLKSGLKFFLAFYFVRKNFLKWFSLFLLDHPIIKLYTKGMNWIWFVFWLLQLTQFKFCTNPGLSWLSFEQTGPEFWPYLKSIYQW